MQNLILQNAIWYVFCDIIIDNKLYVIMDIFVYLTKVSQVKIHKRDLT